MEVMAGRHRIAAARKLGWEEIEAREFDGDKDHARLWEIAENLHRADLTALERSEMIAEWVRLTGRGVPPTRRKLPQVGDVSGGRGTGQRTSELNFAKIGEVKADRFTADTAAKTGRSERDAQRTGQTSRPRGLGGAAQRPALDESSSSIRL